MKLKRGRRIIRAADVASGPSFTIDINVGDGRVGQIGVREGDNAFLLAESFVTAFNLPRSYLRRLAQLIQKRIKSHMDVEERARQEGQRRAYYGDRMFKGYSPAPGSKKVCCVRGPPVR
jgi:hypothetical protein